MKLLQSSTRLGWFFALFLLAYWKPSYSASLLPSGELACIHTKINPAEDVRTVVRPSNHERTQINQRFPKDEVTTVHEASPGIYKNPSLIYEAPTTTYEPPAPDTQVVVNSTDGFLKALEGTASTIILRYNGKFDFDYALCNEEKDGKVVYVQCSDHQEKFGTDKNASAVINRSVRIIGERGPLCERPTVRLVRDDDSGFMWVIRQGNVEIRGIHFLGSAHSDQNRSEDQPGYSAILAMRAIDAQERLLIIDNEFNEWTGAAVDVQGLHNVRSYAEYQRDWVHPSEEDGNKIRIERNYFHHNAREGTGYGVGVGGGIHAWIMGNLFAFNRHDVSSTGFAYAGYTAKFNYLMEGGYKYKGYFGYYGQHFDVHGTSLEDIGYGETAGDKFLIANNTIRGNQNDFDTKMRHALEFRGKANSWARFNDNVVVHATAGEAIDVKKSSINSEPFTPYNVSQAGNQYGVDNVNRMLIGDFDGDSLTDLMLTNGTAWWVSRNFERPWEFLHASAKLSNELAVSDVDGDRIDDVLFKEGAAIKYLPRGSGDPKTFATLPADSQDLSMESVAISGKKICFVNTQGKVNCLENGSWQPLRDNGKVRDDGRDLAIDSDGSTWLTSKSGKIYRYSAGRWNHAPGSDGVNIAAGKGQIWLTNTAGKIYKWDETKDTWYQTTGSSAKNIIVSNDGKTVMLTNTAGLNYRWNGTGWSRLYGDF